ncbi:hypothetical protein RA210_U30280 [Rubrivivax sp. A210]|nr:hypothetical protein RA210_U30280 [Rubrivivax sp. A210]
MENLLEGASFCRLQASAELAQRTFNDFVSAAGWRLRLSRINQQMICRQSLFSQGNGNCSESAKTAGLLHRNCQHVAGFQMIEAINGLKRGSRHYSKVPVSGIIQ